MESVWGLGDGVCVCCCGDVWRLWGEGDQADCWGGCRQSSCVSSRSGCVSSKFGVYLNMSDLSLAVSRSPGLVPGPVSVTDLWS